MPISSKIHQKFYSGEVLFSIRNRFFKIFNFPKNSRFAMFVESSHEAKNTPELSVEELLSTPNHPVLMKDTTLLKYLDPLQDTASRTFETEEGLLLVLTGSQWADPVFDGWRQRHPDRRCSIQYRMWSPTSWLFVVPTRKASDYLWR